MIIGSYYHPQRKKIVYHHYKSLKTFQQTRSRLFKKGYDLKIMKINAKTR